MMTRRNRRNQLAKSMAVSLFFLLVGLMMSLISYGLLAHIDEIAAFTGDKRNLIGQLGIIAGVGAFLAFAVIPLCFIEERR